MSKNLPLLGFTKISSRVLLLSFFVIAIFTLAKVFEVKADSVTTSVTVGNSAPAFTVTPFEDPASSTTTPTNVGSNVVFKATATDANNDNYYLILCSTNSVTPVNGSAPTCVATTWCTSTSTSTASQASCSRTALIGDASSNAWYAFVCDGSSSASCSAGSQGTGDSGSPFIVNHRPGFSAVSNDSPKNPGQTITWSTTASDSDSNTVKLIVCKTTGITGDACDGGGSDTWCSSSFVASNPTCGYSIPSVAPDGSNNAYVYIVDQHNFPSTDAYQGSNVSFTISNVAPVVSAVTINSGAAINLEESTTKAITLTATVTDSNSCAGAEIASVLGYVYRSGITYGGCDTSGEANNNNCYPEVSCTVVGGSCTGTTDASADYTCTVNLQYHADPTDDNTQYTAENWLNTIKATDNNSATHATQVSAGVELNSLIGIDLGYTVTASLNYGSLGAGQTNDPLDKILTTTPTGNVGLDQEHSGSANMCVNYPTCTGGTPIPVANQKYSLTAATAYASGIALSTTETEVELNIPKPLTTTPTTKNTWWGMHIPIGTVSGEYSGVNTITAVKGDVLSW